VPLLLVLVLLIVQFAVWAHATHIAQATAAQAVAAARAEGGTAADGQTQAAALLDQLGRSVLNQPSVRVDRGPAEVTVTVTGSAEPVLPWPRLPVHARAHGPAERFVPAQAPTGG
jgi:Flp pilus assembly protein TadG